MINTHAEKYFHLKADKVVGKNIKDINLNIEIINLFKRLKRSRTEKIMTGEISTGQRERKKITQVKASQTVSQALEGIDEKYFHLIIKAITNTKGKKIEYILIARDITREKTIERLKNEFISISAHQLRTPLSAIKWTLQMILNGSMGKVEGEVRDYINKAHESNERMIILVNDLLNVSRIEEGRFLQNLEPVAVEDLIKEVIFSLSILASKKKIKVDFQKPKYALPKIQADYKKLKLAIQNLVDNALKYSIIGNKVIIKLEKLEQKRTSYIMLEIKDNGIGISARDQARLFVKFFRGANAIRMRTEGSGLGLFIVKNIIEAHKGKIWYKSGENKGTSFYIKLPIT
jgi:signal transduction histidine kinase